MSSTIARAAAAAFLAAALATPLSAQSGDHFHWTGTLRSGQTLEIKGVNGDVSAVPSDGDEVVVDAVKHGRRSDPASVHIEVVPGEDGTTICAVYPTPRNADRENTCAPGRGGHMSTHNNDVSVDFTVHVPAGVRFRGRTVNGGISAKNLKADVDIATVNGNAEATTSGNARAQTVNGSVDVRMGRGDWTGDAEFSTVNGGITLELPAGFGADVDASTVNGSIQSDFPMTVQGRVSPRHLRATIGDGGRGLKLSTVNGSIRLKRGT